jgi:hypothetical protein
MKSEFYNFYLETNRIYLIKRLKNITRIVLKSNQLIRSLELDSKVDKTTFNNYKKLNIIKTNIMEYFKSKTILDLNNIIFTLDTNSLNNIIETQYLRYSYSSVRCKFLSSIENFIIPENLYTYLAICNIFLPYNKNLEVGTYEANYGCFKYTNSKSYGFYTNIIMPPNYYTIIQNDTIVLNS